MMKTIFFFMGLTIGGLTIEVKNLREHDQTTLDAKAECAYHEGMADGMTQARAKLKK